MRKQLTIIALVAGLGLLAPAGAALAHTPGKACQSQGKSRDKNPHCQTGHSSLRTSAKGGSNDPDSDGVATWTTVRRDNCPNAYNPKQGDVDGDGIGNVCDHVLDGDDAGGECDADPALCGTKDTDKDGAADDENYAVDTDGDGFGDEGEDPIGAD